MKLIYKIIGGIIVLFIVSVFVIQIVGSRYLTHVFDEYLAPKLEETLGVSVRMDVFRLDLFSQKMVIEGLEVSNPSGYTGDMLKVERCVLSVSLPLLLRREVYVKRFDVEQAYISIVVKDISDVNILKVVDRVNAKRLVVDKREEGGAEIAVVHGDGHSVASSSELSEKVPMDFTLKNISTDFNVSMRIMPDKYINEEYHFDWNFIIEARDISNKEGADSGSVIIKSGNSDGGDAPIIDLHGIVRPLVDIFNPSFELNGRIFHFNMSRTRGWCEFIGIGSDDVSAVLTVSSRDGVYVDGSKVELTFNDPELYGYLKKRLGSIDMPDMLHVQVPVVGVWNNPHIQVQPVIERVVVEQVKSGLIEKYVPEQYQDQVKEFTDSFDDSLDKFSEKLGHGLEKGKESIGDKVDSTKKILENALDASKKSMEGSSDDLQKAGEDLKRGLNDLLDSRDR